MSPGNVRPLTDRQRAVMERIDRRVPIKVIAQELGVSETRINQHIRALKDIFEAASLGELVENYRSLRAANNFESSSPPLVDSFFESVGEAFSEPAYSKNQISPVRQIGDGSGRDDPGRLVMSDVMPLLEQAPWLRPGEPRVVPGVLDGEHALLFRLVAVVGIATGILAAVVLTITAAVALSEAMEGRVSLPVAEQSGTG